MPEVVSFERKLGESIAKYHGLPDHLNGKVVGTEIGWKCGGTLVVSADCERYVTEVAVVVTVVANSKHSALPSPKLINIQSLLARSQ
jgi:hypothetical protein